MTATQPRVRVNRRKSDGLWYAACEGCGQFVASGWRDRHQLDDALTALNHERDCAPLRLAALLASLETLRDQWRDTPGDGWRAIAYRCAADDLHRVIEGARG